MRAASYAMMLLAASVLSPSASAQMSPATPSGLSPAARGVPAAGSASPGPRTAAPPSVPPTQAPIPTRQNTFLIPFTVDDSEGLPREIQLFVSSDQGASWQLYARQNPADGHFRFRAASDGEYWFAPKTVDQYNRVRPPGPPRPGLRMLVDTRQPDLRFEAQWTRTGAVQTNWEASDENLVPESLKIEYQDAVGTRWQPVATDPPPPLAPGAPFRGGIQWMPQTDSRAINIRAEIQDTAGNRTIVNRRLFLPRQRVTPSTPPAPPKPPAGGVPGDPFAQSTSDGGIPWLAGESGSDSPPNAPGGGDTAFRPALGNNLGARPPSSAPAGASALTSAGTSTGSGIEEPAPRPPTNRWSGWAGSYPGSTRPASTLGDDPDSAASPYRPISRSSGNDAAADFPANSVGPQLDGNDSGSPNTGSTNTGSSSSFRPNSSAPASRDLASPAPPEQRHYGLPPGERPRLTNSRRFSLEYDVDAVGPAGVASVELWTTTDGGRTWTRWGEDPDRRSPFEVEVDTEGVYGFRVVIVANNGLAGRSPQSGDLADLWVAVDTTKPTGRLTSAQYGQGEAAGQLIIQWEADDEWLGARPITLLFSEHLDGPWTTIASGLPNDGRYAWQADPRMPREIYLRMEVRDQAGNVGVYQLSDAISVEGLAPRGRIRGFNPRDGFGS